jgi:hypothetical protein
MKFSACLFALLAGSAAAFAPSANTVRTTEEHFVGVRPDRRRMAVATSLVLLLLVSFVWMHHYRLFSH